MPVIKVQIFGRFTMKSLKTSGFDVADKNYPLTFHAYSDQGKARILEQLIKSDVRIGISFTDEEPRDGEWHEPPIINDAIFNHD